MHAESSKPGKESWFNPKDWFVFSIVPGFLGVHPLLSAVTELLLISLPVLQLLQAWRPLPS
jgi:hypothetical protein